MELVELQKFITKIEPEVLEAVEVASSIRSASMKASFQEGLQKKFPFDKATWQAFWENAIRMKTVVRKTGIPYATHPTKMALILYFVLGKSDQTHKAAQVALLHDYLEEGDGFTPETFDAANQKVDLCPEACLGAVLLSEPMIDYDVFKAPNRIMQHIAYTKQILLNKNKLKTHHFNAVMADKIDNGHDWEYITGRDDLSEESKRTRLAVRLGYMKFILINIGCLADARLADLLNQTIAYYAKYFSFKQEELDVVVHRLENLIQSNGTELRSQIEEYHNRMKIWT